MNTLKLDLIELEIDEHQNEIATRHYDKYFDYNETFKSLIVIPYETSGYSYKTITFNEVTSPFALVIISDKLIDVKVNNFEIHNTKMLILNTNIDSLQIANVDLSDATVSVYIWGIQ